MPGFSLQDIIDATSGRTILRGRDYFSGISIDSRSISDSELFIALRGARFDGHDFIGEALKKGAGAIVNYPPASPVSGKTIIHVTNTLKALQDIAEFHRNKRDVRVVAVTGTNGKTTTKEMLCQMLRGFCNVLCSSGNLNNNIGLPLSLLKLSDEDVCILEMGASMRGDIKELCEISHPDTGIITNIGPGHLEGFGSIDAVKDTKLELCDFVGTLIINLDDELLSRSVESLAVKDDKRVVYYGINNEAPVMAKNIRISGTKDRKRPGLFFDLHIDGFEPERINMKISGVFNVYNALAACSAAHIMGVPVKLIKSGLEAFSGVAMRFEIKELQGTVVISDVYNANPSSMEEAVKELIRIKEGKAVAVLGDMLELGSYAEEAHRKLGAWLAGLPVDIFVAVGPLMALAANEFRNSRNGISKDVYTVNDADSAKGLIRDITGEGDTILVKGSRGMNMEHILEADCAV
ncbi:UDP-N-acetylmuramoyl-tripeptide--D-alanyl-D-alanine ligase [bacterium BMS3Bbin05]|nr:UDP-N-acetylmuramoyl-tripeptide--D-alanyl-D-alanine ligase [bacterium BMS3Bbin05]HDL20526.1 UDP-N-acetylmuramoyl-tripeptide--D-alanyl-D-alanine ligase [Nitrospirota bacterium]HDO21851.1 UDP-N-acetylmuramoyl-tripeptide--D-alanyl-D-alanine ligase [Nitrospirota bacterium]HDZ87166.1 UDP-N-acetylmuramoyl-tripeptide--D-alanyl-D-alanine ligase [Nitrospirota bacterium]